MRGICEKTQAKRTTGQRRKAGREEEREGGRERREGMKRKGKKRKGKGTEGRVEGARDEEKQRKGEGVPPCCRNAGHFPSMRQNNEGLKSVCECLEAACTNQPS